MKRPLVMGILNVTPDSFYEASRAAGLEHAVARGLRMEQEGADLIDVGGESTRPGADPVDGEEESRRVLPVVSALAKKVRIPLSIDTYKASVAERALSAGASLLNDVTALRADPAMIRVAARYPTVLIMHMRGTSPRTMQGDPSYTDVIGELSRFFRERLAEFSRAGGRLERVWLDPGIGFGKTVEHNLEILRGFERFHGLGRPLVLGASRKSFIGRILARAERADEPLAAEERLEGSLAVACRAAEAGAFAVRVHDVAQTRRALEVFCGVRPRKP